MGPGLRRDDSWRIFAREQRARRRCHVGLPHQAFTDEERIHADACEARKIVGREDAAFADANAVLRDQRRKIFAGFKRDLESAQVAVVDTEQRGFQLQRAVEFRTVVNFEQHVHAMGEGRVFDVLRGRIIKCSHDDEDAVAPWTRASAT